jgi:hypothetical protein
VLKGPPTPDHTGSNSISAEDRMKPWHIVAQFLTTVVISLCDLHTIETTMADAIRPSVSQGGGDGVVAGCDIEATATLC